MVTKWTIKGHEKYRFGEDSEIYRLPCEIGKKGFGFRKLIKQPGERWRIDGAWLSYNQMKSSGLLKRDPDPMQICGDETDCPF